MDGIVPIIHEDHIAGEGSNSLHRYNLVHKFIPMPQAMKVPAAKAALDKEWEKLENILTWNLTKVRNKSKVIDRWSKEQGQKGAFCLTDGHLSSGECRIGEKHKKYKGRVVLRGDTVNDDSGFYSVFTEQGSSASQMTSAKVMEIYIKTSRIIRTSSWCSIRYKSGQNGRYINVIENSKVRMSRYLDTSATTPVA